jgi:hypothetical protein
MRFTILLLPLLLSAGPARADDADRVRVALALAGTDYLAAPDTAERVRVALALSAGCGACLFDEAESRAKALKANKPLVLFVGESCARFGKVAREAGAVACVVKGYYQTGYAETAPRAVVLMPTGGRTFGILSTLVDPTAEQLRAAVRTATPPVPATLPPQAPPSGGSYSPHNQPYIVPQYLRPLSFAPPGGAYCPPGQT